MHNFQFIPNIFKRNFNFDKMVLKFLILLNLYLGLLEFLSYSYVYGNEIDSVDVNVDTGINLDIGTTIDDNIELENEINNDADNDIDNDISKLGIGIDEILEINSDSNLDSNSIDYGEKIYSHGSNKFINSKPLSQNQRNVTIEIPTYESDVSEPQFQFNLISPSPNETWTIG